MNTDVKEIRYLVLHDPRPIKFMFKSKSEDKHRLTGIIGRMIPYRIGIEFELFGTLSNLVQPTIQKYLKSHQVKADSSSTPKQIRDLVNQEMIKKFNLVDYSEDLYYAWNDKREVKGELNEIRVSINGVRQLNSLWNICKALNENCKIPAERGGIHIHIDFTSAINYSNKAKSIAKAIIGDRKTLDKILTIFGGYKGTYNKRGVAINSKGWWVNITNKNTIEFRIGKLTYDYQTIIRWIYELSKIVAEINNTVFRNDVILEAKPIKQLLQIEDLPTPYEDEVGVGEPDSIDYHWHDLNNRYQRVYPAVYNELNTYLASTQATSCNQYVFNVDTGQGDSNTSSVQLY